MNLLILNVTPVNRQVSHLTQKNYTRFKILIRDKLTLGILTFSRITLNITDLIVTHSINDSQHTALCHCAEFYYTEFS